VGGRAGAFVQKLLTSATLVDDPPQQQVPLLLLWPILAGSWF